MRKILLPLLLFFQAVLVEDMSHRLKTKDTSESTRWKIGGEKGWAKKSGKHDEKPSLPEGKSFWKEKLFSWMQRPKPWMQGDKSRNTWKTWKENSWAKRPTTGEKPSWAVVHSWEKRTKPGWNAHSLEKRPTTEENPSWKEHNWEKRPTTETKEKPKWAEHSWEKRPTTEEKGGWKEGSWVKKHGGKDQPTTWSQTNCNDELSAKFSAMDAKMEEMTKDLQNSLNMLYKKVEALIDPTNIKNATRKGSSEQENEDKKATTLRAQRGSLPKAKNMGPLEETERSENNEGKGKGEEIGGSGEDEEDDTYMDEDEEEDDDEENGGSVEYV